MSLVFEYMNGGSVLNVLQSAGAIPEDILKSIAKRCLEALDFLHTKAGIAHGGLTLS